MCWKPSKAMIGGKYAPLTIMSSEDTGIDSMITTFNTTVTETANETLGKHRQKKRKKNWVTAEILDLCDKRRELRKQDCTVSQLRLAWLKWLTRLLKACTVQDGWPFSNR